MKKKLFVLLLCALAAANCFAQRAFDYLRDSLVTVLSVSTIVQVVDYEYKESGALWGTYLEAEKTCSLSSQFDAGVEYLMLSAAHDTRNCDVDLKVYEGRGTGGTVLGRDINADATPIVRFIPRNSGYHTFELINSGSRPAFVSLVILRYKRNANFSMRTLAEALDNTLVVSQYISSMLPPGAEIPANKWTLFGGNLQVGNSTGYFNTTLSPGDYILVGAGENSVNNCDVEIVEQYAYDNASGRLVSANTNSRHPFDFAIFSAQSSKYYNLKVFNKSSAKSGSFVFGFLILGVKN